MENLSDSVIIVKIKKIPAKRNQMPRIKAANLLSAIII